MFIDTTMKAKTCAPAERDVPAIVRDPLRFAPLERRGIRLEVARSINISSLRDEEALRLVLSI